MIELHKEKALEGAKRDKSNAKTAGLRQAHTVVWYYNECKKSKKPPPPSFPPVVDSIHAP